MIKFAVFTPEVGEALSAELEQKLGIVFEWEDVVSINIGPIVYRGSHDRPEAFHGWWYLPKW